MLEMDLSALILAGGESRRMGRDKAWVRWKGKPLIECAVDTVRALGVSEILISGRAGQDFSAFDYPVLFDLEPGLGPLGGIERGLRECASSLLLVLAVDLPGMTAAFLCKLHARCDHLTGAVPKLHGQIEPLAAIYPKRCHVLASELYGGQQRSARSFADACLREHAVCCLPVSTAEAECFANCNTPKDLPKSR
jgi:molybdopterin-guanine dinucleotide biosynthesis protein A